MKKYTLDEVKEIGWSHGYVFGKYTAQTQIDDDLLVMLDNSQSLILSYVDSYNDGFKAGLADTKRQD